MEKYLMVLFILIGGLTIQAQTQAVKIVLDLTSPDKATQESALRHLRMMSEAYPDSEFELVVYGKAISIVVEEDSPFVEEVKAVEGKKRASIKVCAVALKRNNIGKDQLLPGVKVVPDAIMEIVKRQTEGWSYIKEAN